MKFEIVRDGQVLAWTEQVECIYSLPVLREMQKAGINEIVNR